MTAAPKSASRPAPRGPLFSDEELRANPHREMHVRGG